MKNMLLPTVVTVGMFVSACTHQKKQEVHEQISDSSVTKTIRETKSYISIFEIPATDLSRAVNFYQAILNIKIQKMDIPEIQMGIFPHEGQMVTGVIIKAEGYKPSADGAVLYLNGGDDLQVILDKVEKNGGKILVPKTLHADESGYFALLLDSEGNKIGLHSTN